MKQATTQALAVLNALTRRKTWGVNGDSMELRVEYLEGEEVVHTEVHNYAADTAVPEEPTEDNTAPDADLG